MDLGCGVMYYNSKVKYTYFEYDNNYVDNRKKKSVYLWEKDREPLERLKFIFDKSSFLDFLKRQKIPADGTYIFDGTYDTVLVDKMYTEYQEFEKLRNAYIALKTPRGELHSIFEQIDKVTQILFPDAYKDNWKDLLKQKCIAENVPVGFFSELSYTYLIRKYLVGVAQEISEKSLRAKVICACWADMRQDDTGFMTNNTYISQKGEKYEVTIVNPWNLPQNQRVFQIALALLLNLQIEEVLNSRYYVRRQEINDPVGDTHDALAEKYIRENGLEYKTTDELLSNLVYTKEEMEKTGKMFNEENVLAALQGALDDILNKKFKNLHFEIDSQKNEKYFEVYNLMDGLYAFLSEEIISGFPLRKCLLCEEYFYSTQPARKYCDYHQGDNAKYHRRKLNKMMANKKNKGNTNNEE